MLYLDKILAQLAYPLGLSTCLALLGLLLLVVGRRGGAALALLFAVGWVAGWSLPVVGDTVRGALESRYPNLPIEELPAAEAVVVLGGGVEAGPPGWPYPDLGSASDRVWHAARIYQAGKAGRVIVSGGAQGWRGPRGSEAGAMEAFLGDLGVPADRVTRERQSRSTRENALFTARLLDASGIHRVLLVTSAMHMPRAAASFRAEDVEVIPAPTDYEVMPEPPHLLRWLPDAEALADSSAAIKEYLGLWAYRWRGWAG
ncbi:YdcF family protein [Arhodomonas sp. SL1]|uniref:YdcF family protein n=1 Tax=Arhodomonas sp. SL1 TaxID=3425691 RepID=UPI003F880EC8